MDKKQIEEYLELVWLKKETLQLGIVDSLGDVAEKIGEKDFCLLVDEGYVYLKGSAIDFYPKGEKIARRIIRGHRLAERLFTDVLELNSKVLESNACSFEHIIHDEIAEAICTLLGHPRECPHGKAIPEGDCCRRAFKEVNRLIVPLSELKAGDKARVVYITSRQLHRLNRLSSLGMMPGVFLSVRQTFPTPIIEIEQSQIAVEKSILNDIHVRKIS